MRKMYRSVYVAGGLENQSVVNFLNFIQIYAINVYLQTMPEGITIAITTTITLRNTGDDDGSADRGSYLYYKF